MKQSLLQKLCCPQDKSDLELETISLNPEGEILEGVLICTHCQRYYPIIYGLPILSPDEYREPPLEAPVLRRWGRELSPAAEQPFRLSALQALPEAEFES